MWSIKLGGTNQQTEKRGPKARSVEDRKTTTREKTLPRSEKRIYTNVNFSVFPFPFIRAEREDFLPKMITLGNRPESVKDEDDDSDRGFLDDPKGASRRWSTSRWPENIIRLVDAATTPRRNGRRGATSQAPTGDGVHAKSVTQEDKTKGTIDIIIIIIIIITRRVGKRVCDSNLI